MAVDPGEPIFQMDMVAGDTDDALDDMLLGIGREMKDHDVAGFDIAIGEEPSPGAGREQR